MPWRPEVPAWPAEPMSAGPAAVPTQRGPAQWVLQRHFQNVEPPGDAVHRVDDAALVDEHVVDLDGARPRSSPTTSWPRPRPPRAGTDWRHRTLAHRSARRSRARPTHRIHSPLTAPPARRTTMGRVRLGRPGRAGSAEEEPCD